MRVWHRRDMGVVHHFILALDSWSISDFQVVAATLKGDSKYLTGTVYHNGRLLRDDETFTD